MRFCELPDGYVELKNNGTYVEYPVKFIFQNNKIYREERGNLSIVPPKLLLTVDSTTGNIKQTQKGFIADHEVMGVPQHENPSLKYAHIIKSEIPSEFFTKEGNLDSDICRFNLKTNKLVKIT